MRDGDGVGVLVNIGVGNGVIVAAGGWPGGFDEARSRDEEMAFCARLTAAWADCGKRA